MGYFLAIDSGGTQAQYLLADEHVVLARTVSGTIKRMRTSAADATEHLESALHELERMSGVPMSRITQTCVGAAGSSVPLVADWLRTEIGNRVAGRFLLLNDVEIALDAAFPGEGGILVLAGTGSNVVGRTPSGWITNAGGWGPVPADQGSGHQIGLRAIRAVFLAMDEGEPTTLYRAMLDHWQLETREALVAHANSCSTLEFSRLTHAVQACAAAGDAVARRVLEREGAELAHLALLVHRRLAAHEYEDGPRRIAFAGGVMAHLPLVREGLLRALAEGIAEVRAAEGVVHGIDGALWRARREAS